jgi:hypothetical protein
MQEFVLYHYANDHQEMGVYHCQQSFEIYDAELSLNAFKKALKLLVQKHPALRTVFIVRNGKPLCQIVKKNCQHSIDEIDISHMKSNSQEKYIEDFMKQDRQRLFNVENTDEPLFRFALFPKARNKFEFLLSIHHAIADGWGNIEFINELKQFYAALKRGEQISMAPLANVYQEFVALEKQIVESKEASTFWRLQLENRVAKPLKPLANPAKKGETFGIKYNLDSQVIADLGKLCGKWRVSPKAIFVSIYLDLIGNEAKEDVACVGIVSNGRTDKLSDPFKALGLFWNIVPVSQPIISNKVEQIKNVQQYLVDIEPYVQYPLLQIQSDQENENLFFATFNFVHFHKSKNSVANGSLKLDVKRSYDKFNFPLNFALSMDAMEKRGSIAVEYDRMYFTAERIRQMVEQYSDQLKEIVSTV